MSINNSITNNPNARLFILREVADAFRGYIAGLSGGDNSLFTFASDAGVASIVNEIDSVMSRAGFDFDNKSEIEGLLSSILDTSQGAYLSKDFFQQSKIYSNKTIEKLPSNLDDRINTIRKQLTVISTEQFKDELTGQDDNPIPVAENNTNVIMSFDDGKVIDINNLIEEGFPEIVTNDDGTNRTFTRRSLSVKNSSESVNDFDTSLTAFILKDKFVTRQSRFKDFLNVFLNGIPPIEMSRCSPYLDITIYQSNRSKKSKKYLNHAYHMRFEKDADGNSMDPFSLTTARRVEADTREDGRDMHFMSIFTSPQTLSNANINRKYNDFSWKNDVRGAIDDNVLEPIVPMLTLNSFNVTIDGMGHGLTSSRKGSISMVLHDRSRLEDFAPLVSLAQLAGTDMRIEFGWSHPDADPLKSENIIGKFLNSCRDVQFYQLNTTSLSFNNNAVNIDIQISASGGELAKQVTAAAGFFSPLSFISNKINSCLERIMAESSAAEEGKNEGESTNILPNLKVIRTDVNNVAQVAKTEDYRELLKILSKSDENGKPNDVDVLRQVLKCLNLSGDEEIPESKEELLSFLKEKKRESRTNKNLKNTAELIMNKLDYATRPGTKEELRNRDLIINQSMHSDFIGSVAALGSQSEADFNKEYKASLKDTLKSRAEQLKQREESLEKKQQDLSDKHDELGKKFQAAPEGSEERKRIEKQMDEIDAKTEALSEKFEDLNNAFAALQDQIKLVESKSGKSGDAQYVTQEITFAKLFMMYCALPMVSTCRYSEIQVYFYTINHQAGGARKYTTASFPLPVEDVREALEKKFKEGSGNLTVQAMFAFLAKLVKNTSLPAYEIEGDFEQFKEDELDEEDRSVILEDAIDQYLADNPNSDGNIRGDTQKEDAVINSFLKKKFNQQKDESINKIYENDGLQAVESSKVVEPVFNMHMEVLPVIQAQKPESDANKSFFDNEFLFGAVNENLDNSGYNSDKKILRMHVYDRRSAGSPKAEFMNQIIKNGKISVFSGKIPSLDDFEKMIAKDSSFNALMDIGEIDAAVGFVKSERDRFLESQKLLQSKISDAAEQITSYVNNMPIKQFRSFIKRSYPNVTWGAASSVVKSLGISSNTSDRVAQNILIRRKREARSGGAFKNSLVRDQEVSIFPSSITLELLGCPFIDRGAQIYIDTGTGTDLDNVYTVNNVTHSLKSGEFTTSLKLLCTGQGTIASQQKVLSDKLEAALQSIEETEL